MSLHLYPNLLDGKNVPVELVGVAENSALWFPNLLATAGFYVMKDGWLAAPGVVFPSLVQMYSPGSHLPHVMWSPPFPWGDELAAVEVDPDTSVHWLLAVPLSESERRFMLTNGYDALEDLLEENDVQFFDLDRASTV